MSATELFQANRQFCTTHWSAILKANTGGPDAFAALEGLCSAYWYPLYAFARRRGHSPEDAQDLVQGFFEHLLGGTFLEKIDACKGRFRTFLLASLGNFISNSWARQNRQKRGGGAATLSFDAEDAESKYRLEPVDNMTPEKLFEQRWAETVVSRVGKRLEMEYVKAGQRERYESLKAFLMSHSSETSYAEIGASIGLSEGGVKTSVRRLRLRFRDLLREELAQTVESPEEVDEEIRALLLCLAGW